MLIHNNLGAGYFAKFRKNSVQLTIGYTMGQITNIDIH